MRMLISTLTSTPYSWVVSQPSIVVNLIHVHGDADLVTAERHVFAGNAEGQEQCKLLIDVVTQLALTGTFERSLLDIAGDVSQKVTTLKRLAEDELERYFDTILKADAHFGDGSGAFAQIAAYTLSFIDEAGVQKEAWFGGVRYKKLTGIDPFWLKPWA